MAQASFSDQREKFDRLMDAIDAFEPSKLSDAEFSAQFSDLSRKEHEAFELARAMNGNRPSALACLVRLSGASRTALMGERLNDAAVFYLALERCNEALELLGSLEESAPLVEISGVVLRGNLLATVGDIDTGIAHLRGAIDALEPHVARMQEIRATGSEAEILAIELADRWIRAERLLIEAKTSLTAMEDARAVS